MDTTLLIAWVPVLAVAVVAWLVWRGGGSTALGTLETANRILERRVHELEARQETDTKLIAELQTSRDFAASVAPLITAMQAHELNSDSRSQRTNEALERLIVTLAITPHAGTLAPRTAGEGAA